MRTLLVTGQLARGSVEKYAREGSREVEILALPLPVAALLTPSQIAKEIRRRELEGFDLILVPGLIRGDISIIEEASGVPTFRGPKYAADLPLVLKFAKHAKLSKTIPACEVLKDELMRRTSDELENAEKNKRALLKRQGNILMGRLAVGRDFPMRIMAEILDAPLLSDEEIQEQAEYYEKSGAHIIDIGMISGESRPEDAERAVRAVKRSLALTVSIDTFDVDEAKAAVSAGADLLLSVDAGNVEAVSEFASEIAVVVIPTNHRERYFPKMASERVKTLEENIRKAVELGMRKVVGDMILDPVNVPGIMESLSAYREFSLRNPRIPFLFGVGNVTELMDADTVGVNALLAGMASELGAGILLTTEGSDKTRGCVRELAVASEMMFLARKRSSAPKDLGLDLLILKDKKLKDESYDKKTEEETRVINAKEAGEEELDPRGCFKISVDRKEKLLVVTRFLGRSREEVIKGKNAREVCTAIINMGLVSTLSHAAYIGRELEKAETALKIGKTYIQDEPLFGLFPD